MSDHFGEATALPVCSPDRYSSQVSQSRVPENENTPPSDKAVLAGTVRTNLPRNRGGHTSHETRITCASDRRSRKTESRVAHFRRPARLSCNPPPNVRASRSGFFQDRPSLSKQISSRRGRLLS